MGKLFRYLSLLFFSTPIFSTTWIVDNAGDTNTITPGNTTLRGALLHAISGDTINFDPSITTITLTTGPLPVITQSNLTISSSNQTSISPSGSTQIFSAISGNVTLENLYLLNGVSQGGAGGDGNATGGGGGGGVGGGGNLYLHTGANVILNGVILDSGQAKGGNGGSGTGALNAGGGGGGFGGGNGGNGTSSGSGGGGGGGGGHPDGGSGGSNSGGSMGGTSSIIGGGGGGGSGGTQTGGACQVTTSSTNPGGAGSSTGGGGGAGLGGAGSTGSTVGGIGGVGIGSDTFFGGGGGGGNKGNTSANDGGAGYGAGGGGGSYQGEGGVGGTLGGGGGAGNTRGGGGSFGGGGGGVAAGGTSTSSPFGGGNGGLGSGASGGGGGGGAGLGGNIFIQSGAVLTIGDSAVNSSVIQFGLATFGTAGAGGATPATNGLNLGNDIFIRSGGTLVFTNSSNFTLLSNIESNQGQGDSFIPTEGGLIIQGTGMVTLGSLTPTDGVNTYTASTKILSGTLQIFQNSNLGDTTIGTNGNNVVIQNGTLLTSASVPFSIPRTLSLTGSATINTNTAPTLTYTGPISGSGSLTKAGIGTLYLNPTVANTYNGGTIVSQGILQISAIGTADSALGPATTQVTLQDQTTFNTIDPGGLPTISSIRPFVLGGQASFQIDNTTTLLSGNITGSGQLVKTGLGALVLGGNNSYTASASFTYGTDIQQGTLVGNSSSLQGNINIGDGTTLIFLQAAAGTYSGSLTSGPLNTGVLQIGNATISPFPLLTISGSSPGFLGTTHIFPSGVLSVTSSLANSPFVIDAGGFLKGTGIVGSTTSSGTIAPGGSIGTLTVNGDLALNPTSNLEIAVSPTTSSLLQVLGNATLNGTLSVINSNTSGFFGLGNSYTILTNTGTQSGTFAFVNSDPNFVSTVTYTPHAVILNLKVEQPFLNFPYDNPNEQSVGENLDALVASGALTGSSPLGMAINSLAGFSDEAVDNALDQMHPAAFSAFSELQAAVGGQLLTMFHRRPVPYCVCSGETRFWVQPYGNWLKEKNVGYELGFNANLKGAAVGFDTEITEGWTVGIGFTWNKTHLQWRKGRGNASIQGYYAAAYTDYATDNFYIGLSCLQGFDNCKSSRHINFSTVHEEAHATRSNRETIGQLALAAFFGPGACFAFPYVNVDYFYLKEHAVQESGAPGLNLSVREHSQSTLRTEAGFAVQVQDINKNNTMCVSPLFGLGWAMELPLHRPPYKSNFEGQTIPFNVQGWDYTWQLFTLRFGFTITYKCVSIYGGYLAEMSPLETTPFFDQRGDIRLEISW